MRQLAANHGLKMMVAGAHPFSHWDRELEESPPLSRPHRGHTVHRPSPARLRHERPRRHRRQKSGHRCHERNALPAAPHPLPCQRLTFLAGPRYRVGQLPLRPLGRPAPHRHSPTPSAASATIKTTSIPSCAPTAYPIPKPSGGTSAPTPISRTRPARALMPAATPSPVRPQPNRPRSKFASATPCPISTTCSPSPR